MMPPTFEPTTDRPGVAVFDPIENVQFPLYVSPEPELTSTNTSPFYFPVDAAVLFEASTIEVPRFVGVFVRTEDGEAVAHCTPRNDELSVPHGRYIIELNSTPIKLYLTVENGFSVRYSDTDETYIEFDTPAEIRLGARSFHDQPTGTITTTDDVTNAMRAMSYLGSALKTTSPERSFPTLRGHPPLVERGDGFSVPDGIERPDTGVRLELPVDWEYVYPATSLAFYLGAEVVPADEPRLVADGVEYALDRERGYEETVARFLRQTFFLDCLTRTEGYYPIDLHERNAVEDDLDLDFAALYDRPLAERVAEHLSVPFDAVADHVPDWNLTTDIRPSADNVETLPFVANDLAIVRSPSTSSGVSLGAQPEELTDFYRDDALAAGDFTRSTGVGNGEPTGGPTSDVVDPEDAPTVEHEWVGEGFPLGANKATVEGFRTRVNREAPDRRDIQIHVVCNDEEMREEGVVNEFYGQRDLFEFDVSVHYDLTTDELRALFGQSSDFLHFIGHVDEAGMHCPDGFLDAETLGSVGVEAFLLNACRSYEQGEALVDAGSSGGVVTLSEVANITATRVGQTFARLLNCGYSLRVALSIAKTQSLTGYRYITVGDGQLQLVETESGVLTHLEVERLEGDRFELNVLTYPTPDNGMGSTYTPNIGNDETVYLASGNYEFTLSGEELRDFLDLEQVPVEVGDELCWSHELSLEEI